MSIPAMDVHVGMVIRNTDGRPCHVENREVVPRLYLCVALTLRDLDFAKLSRVLWRVDEPVELALLPEREVECLYFTDVGIVLFDPVSCGQYDVLPWVSIGLGDEVQPGRRYLAPFWRGQPVALWEMA